MKECGYYVPGSGAIAMAELMNRRPAIEATERNFILKRFEWVGICKKGGRW